ncbi:MAG: valine--tRNA ligase [Simkaniaceae bacterium]|nr:valine--tRNA ligase [Simkaniaceae bacterium]
MAYESENIEKKWREFYAKSSPFKADPSSQKPPYCIVIPPPNVTGKLHMGHALVDTLQDILIRYKRMMGFETLWLPGTDHAGIATQTVVEQHLIRTEGKRRIDYDRETFLSHLWNWKNSHETHIIDQLKHLGCSCDWSRLRFTLDEDLSLAVKTVFKKLVDDNLIYRGDYLVNWDTITETALADDEVEHEEREGHLWTFQYGPLQIATTRPETMLGDTAVAVSPSDPRYAHLIGTNITLPITGREVPIVADHYVDPSFGTGAVKITPAHDPNDYEIALRHNLPMINIMTPRGFINETGGEFAGLTMQEARAAVIKKMEHLGLLVKVEKHIHRVGVSYRSKAIIEPYLSKQWFVRLSQFKETLMSAVTEGRVKLIPKGWENTYFHWIENLRDWCISRQLWWGHRIPIWYRKDNKEIWTAEEPSDLTDWEQDPDVLDTWFSSALWPFSALGWPKKTEDLAKFYPNSTLITGHDILFFWVARMILMGEYVLGEAPFPETFLHGLIYGKSYEKGGVYVSSQEKKQYDLEEKPLPAGVTARWEKMSKSKGNVIDPLEVSRDYGTDALRYALTFSCTHQRQIDLDMRKFEEFKNFINKLYNGARYVLMNLPPQITEISPMHIEDHWILSRLHRLIGEVHEALASYAFDTLADKTYKFFWDDFCAYYIELTKKGTASQKEILVSVLETYLRLIHPIAPFVTEELYSELHALFPVSCLALASYPIQNKDLINEEAEATFHQYVEVLTAIRTIRAEMKLPPRLATDLYLSASDPVLESFLRRLLPLKEIHIGSFDGQGSKGQVGILHFTIPLPEEMMEAEKLRLVKEREKLMKQVSSLEKQLSEPSFIDKAPPHLVTKTRETLEELKSKLNNLN